MRHSVAVRSILVCCLIAALFTGCSRDPNVKKQKYFDSGERYFADGKYREAAIQYSNAIQVDSRFAQAHYQLAQTYLKLGDASHALDELTKTVALTPDNYRARTDIANLLVMFRNPDGSPVPESLQQAKTHLDILREKQPNVAETHEAWANYYGAQNNLGPAIQEIQQAIAADPDRSESYLALALFELRANQPDLAEENFNKAIKTDPKATNAQLALGAFYQSRNRLADAERQFKHAIELDPKNPGPRAALVRVLRQENKNDEIEPFLKQTKLDFPDNSEGYRMLGDFYFATGNVDKAFAEYASLYADHPKDALVKRNYIQLLILKNRLDDASRLNDETLKSSPHDANAMVAKGQIQLRRNDAAGAVETLQRALSDDRDSAVAHYQLGLAFDQQQNEAQAEAQWREAVRLDPNQSDALRDLAILELQRGNVDGLLQSAQQLIDTQPGMPDGYIYRCIGETSRQKYPEAQKDAQQASQLAPQSPGPFVQLGNVQLMQKHYSEAEGFYRQALDKDPSYSDGLSGLMNTYVVEKQFDKAIAAANDQIAKSPNNSNFYDLLGTALFTGKNDLPAAQAALQKAVELDKTNADAAEKLGKVQMKAGSSDQALALYLQFIKENPRAVRFYILAGELYEARQNLAQAKTLYQQALGISPEQPLASNDLAYATLESGGNVDVALALAQTARRGMPDSSSAADTLGWAYYQKGIYQSAIDQFQEALRLAEKTGVPDDATIHYHLGLAYQKANQTVLARQQLERALKISPNNADAKKALSELHS